MTFFNISSLTVNYMFQITLECCENPIFRMLHAANIIECCIQPIFGMLCTLIIWNVVYSQYLKCCIQPIFGMLHSILLLGHMLLTPPRMMYILGKTCTTQGTAYLLYSHQLTNTSGLSPTATTPPHHTENL
jgi:hypothetical protein